MCGNYLLDRYSYFSYSSTNLVGQKGIYMLLLEDKFIMLSDFDIDKYKETRGYIYLLVDSKFPEYIKIGRTFNPSDRLVAYNGDKPFDTCRFVAISKPFVDVISVEREIIVTARFNNPTARLEWFDVSKTKELLELIHQMELKHQLL